MLFLRRALSYCNAAYPILSTRHRYLRNVLSSVLGEGLNRGLNFLVIIILIRYLGSGEFGRYTYVLTFAAMLGLLGQLGLTNLLIREISRNEQHSNQLLVDALCLQSLVSGLAFVLTIIAAWAIESNPSIRLLITLSALSIAIRSLAGPFLAITTALEQIHLSQAANTLTTLINIGLTGLVIFFQRNLLDLLIIQIIVSLSFLLFTVFTTIISCKSVIVVTPRISSWWPIIRMGIPFFLLGLFNYIYFRIDIVMLSKLSGDSVVGEYNAAYRLLDILIIIIAAISGPLFPIMASRSSTDRTLLSRIFTKAMMFSLAVILPLVLLLTVFSHQVISLLYGSGYPGSVRVLQILIWTAPVIYAYAAPMTALIAIGQEWTQITVNGIGIILNVILNWYLIPLYGASGSAAATVACELFNAGITLALTVHYFGRLEIGVYMRGLGMAMIVLSALTILLSYYLPPLLVTIVCSIIYPMLLLGGPWNSPWRALFLLFKHNQTTEIMTA